MSDELETRSVEVPVEYREDAEDRGYLEGLAMRDGEVTTIYRKDGTSFRERFEAGAIENEGTVWLYNGHKHPVGEVEHSEYREGGFHIRARLALSDLAKSTRELLRSGAIKGLSVGFVELAHRMEDGVRVVTSARLREVSVTPNPAYPGAQILSTREDENPIQGEVTMTDSVTPADVAELRSALEENNRKIDSLALNTRDEEPAVDQRSAGAILKAIVAGDESAADLYHRALTHEFDEVQTRAYTGGVLADAPVKDAWVGDLTRIFDNSSGVLSDIFSTGTLPEKGEYIEFAQLKSNTVTVQEQENEGDDLPVGKIQLETKTAKVHTYGGAVQLSRQQIERSTLPVLNRSLEALAVAAGARKKAVLRAAFNAAVTAREAIASNGGVLVLGSTLNASDAGRWEDLIIDAALRYDQENARPEALVVSASVFKKFRSLTISGERVFTVGEKNASGTLNLPGLSGQLAGLPVRLDPQATGDRAAFVHSRALRQYDSALASLSDENVINLSKTYSVYRYGAVAAEIPQLIVPVKLSA